MVAVLHRCHSIPHLISVILAHSGACQVCVIVHTSFSRTWEPCECEQLRRSSQLFRWTYNCYGVSTNRMSQSSQEHFTGCYDDHTYLLVRHHALYAVACPEEYRGVVDSSSSALSIVTAYYAEHYTSWNTQIKRTKKQWKHQAVHYTVTVQTRGGSSNFRKPFICKRNSGAREILAKTVSERCYNSAGYASASGRTWPSRRMTSCDVRSVIMTSYDAGGGVKSVMLLDSCGGCSWRCVWHVHVCNLTPGCPALCSNIQWRRCHSQTQCRLRRTAS